MRNWALKVSGTVAVATMLVALLSENSNAPTVHSIGVAIQWSRHHHKLWLNNGFDYINIHALRQRQTPTPCTKLKKTSAHSTTFGHSEQRWRGLGTSPAKLWPVTVTA